MHAELAWLDIAFNDLSGRIQSAGFESEHPILLDLRGNSIDCPLPVFGPNMIVDRDRCLTNWQWMLWSCIGFMVAFVASVLVMRTWCFPFTVRTRKLFWACAWVVGNGAPVPVFACRPRLRMCWRGGV